MQRVIKLLLEEGPMTARDIASAVGISARHASGSLGKARRQVYIAGWRRDEDGGRLYPRALWAAGDKADAPPPPPLPRAELNRRHRSRKATVVASVWDLAKPIELRRVGAASI